QSADNVMKLGWQSFGHRERSTPGTHRTSWLYDGGREMNTLHGTTSSAVITRLHDVVRAGEKSGAVSGRGCARGTGRQRPPYMVAIDATSVGLPAANGGNAGRGAVDGGTDGGNHGGTEYREGTGERRS